MQIPSYLDDNYKVKKGEIYKKPNGRKAIHIDDIASLITKEVDQKSTYEDAHKIVKDWFGSKLDSTGDYIYESLMATPLKALSNLDYQLLANFRWALSDRKNKQLVYFRENYENQVYSIVENSDDMFVSLTGTPHAYNCMEHHYMQMVREGYEHKRKVGLLVWDLNTKISGDNLVYPQYTLAEYYKKTAEYFLGSIHYRIQSPKIITNNIDTPAFVYTDLSILDAVKGDCPTWFNWLNIRMPNPEDREIFMAYIYSIFDADNTARQAYWMHDNGQTGKSTITNVIVAFLRDGATSIDDKVANQSRFIGSQIYGKRLITVPDCKNTSLIRTGIVHQALGGDNIPIEFKGQTPFMARVHCKMIVGANYKPELDVTQTHEKSRVLIQELIGNKNLPKEVTDQFTYGTSAHVIEGKLLAEMPAFLAACGPSYRKLCPTQNNIIVSKEVDDRMFDSITTPDTEKYEHILDEYFELGPEYVTPKFVLQDVFKVLYGNEKHRYSDFKKFMSTQVPNYTEGRYDNKHGIKGARLVASKLLTMERITENVVVNDFLLAQERDK